MRSTSTPLYGTEKINLYGFILAFLVAAYSSTLINANHFNDGNSIVVADDSDSNVTDSDNALPRQKKLSRSLDKIVQSKNDGRALRGNHIRQVADEGRKQKIEFDNQQHRVLLPSVEAKHFFSLNDPRTELEKDFQIPKGIVESDVEFRTALKEETIPRSIKILSFGTSQTYGTGLEDRRYSYPFLISPDASLVDNVALPATAADHPSLCLQSMIPDAETKNYDLITIEYPSNQSDGIHLLLRRLRERYPRAIIMFVHVWNFVGRARDTKTGKVVPMFDKDELNDITWMWKEGDPFSTNLDRTVDCKREVCQLNQMFQILSEVNGVAYIMDPDASPDQVLNEGWFASDYHHLTQSGHKNVAIGIANRIRGDTNLWNQVFEDNKPLGTWALGDQCYNWYFSGAIDLNNIQYDDGATFHCDDINVKSRDCSLWIDSDKGATITFQSDFDRDVPIAIGYLTKGNPDTFPTTMVQLNSEEAIRVDPDRDRQTRVNPGSTTLITSYIQLGFAQPKTKNTVTLKPTEVTERPFKLIGIYLCGACKEYQNGHMGIGVLNMDNHGDTQVYDKNYIKGAMQRPGREINFYDYNFSN